MKKLTKLLCVLLCVLFCASLLFSAGSALHGHDCIGEDCQYCITVSMQQELMRFILLGSFSAAFVVLFIRIISKVNSYSDDKKQNVNLVVDKIKLTA